MAFTTAQVTLATTPKIVIAGNAPGRAGEIKNTDAAINIYVGSSVALTTSNGHLVKAGEAFVFEGVADAVYAVAVSGTPVVTVIYW